MKILEYLDSIEKKPKVIFLSLLSVIAIVFFYFNPLITGIIFFTFLISLVVYSILINKKNKEKVFSESLQIVILLSAPLTGVFLSITSPFYYFFTNEKGLLDFFMFFLVPIIIITVIIIGYKFVINIMTMEKMEKDIMRMESEIKFKISETQSTIESQQNKIKEKNTYKRNYKKDLAKIQPIVDDLTKELEIEEAVNRKTILDLAQAKIEAENFLNLLEEKSEEIKLSDENYIKKYNQLIAGINSYLKDNQYE